MVEIFEYFHTNRCLFKCDAHDFDDVIKNTMRKLIFFARVGKKYHEFNTHYQYSYTYCAICLQYLELCSRLAICPNCCNVCINKKIIIDFGANEIYPVVHYVNKNDEYRMILIDDYGDHFIEFERQDKHIIKYSVLTKFIDNSHKLEYKFYHVVPLVFILSLSDPTSECHILNNDIMFYILKFIY